MTNSEELLIYMHIPKTGGTTLKNIIQKQYRKQDVWLHMEKDMNPKMEQKNIEQLKCVGGHCWHGIHAHFDRPYKYFTMLRNPIDRVISEYYYILERPSHKAYLEVKNMNLEQFIHRFPIKSSNQQTRRLSGNIHKPDLEVAKRNIEADFAVVGLSEMFDESITVMKDLFAWGDISYQKANVTKKRPAVEDVSRKVIKQLEELNQMDLEIYEYAKTKLLRQL
ncbi:sulfotransferase family 2 domain-containing protein [Bacillus sp. JJ1562]|uniref:sulfotransferase family 2 domain-containing protein n=1 Tax=Bacillus sp. JJ1562 TaxID=3122960 RepID=UPI00300273D8